MTEAELRHALGWDKPYVKPLSADDRIQELHDWERRLRGMLTEALDRLETSRA